ncbi:S41 family peptidase [Pedobacter sandarakinus]|uniref:S41 family peptidase n=1 Tax=Pedobacter sandarakinus TaxID=353156 RepID=UPI002245B7CC|nr:S41 family peptidase [Pedobacter sandarakinus]MCX2573962.1 S41 family peptidase [Pedobacter sandarakinus]
MIKPFLKSLAAVAFLLPMQLFAQDQTYFASYPALTPDAQTIVFSYDGDIWKVAVGGGVASRITAMPGEEINPKVSPDGKLLAFSSNQFGNNDVYVMPINGGDIKQLTFNDASDEVDNWSWDSKSIYFTSGRYNSFSSYMIGVGGGTPVRLFDNYFNTTHHIAESPNGALFFNDTWESYRFPNRKHYKGAYNPDIQSYNPKTKEYKRYTDYIGKDFWTSVDQKGNVYFVSDEGNDEYNLYTFINGKKTGLTKFETSIKRPFVAANGNVVVFEKDYQLYVYNVGTKQTEKVNISTSRNQVLSKEQEYDVRSNISAFDASTDGKKIAFISRGEVFVSDADGKFIRKITNSGERAMECKWLADNKTILFSQTANGYQNWFSIAGDGKGKVKQLTTDQANNRDICLNKSKTMAVYLSGRNELKLLDLKTFDSKTLVTDEFWAFQNSAPSFSPNDEYVLFTVYRNFEQDILVHQIKTNKTINLTNTGVTETGPSWSPDGKYIFFTSARTKPSYPTGMSNAHIYRMALDNYDEPFRSDKFDDLFKESKPAEIKPAVVVTKEKKSKADTAKKAEAKPTPKPASVITINTQDILDRIELVGPAFGGQNGTDVFAKGDKTYVFFTSNHEGGVPGLYRTTIESFEANKTEKVTDGGDYSIVQAGDKYFVLSRGVINKYSLESNKLDKIDHGYKFTRNLNAEFNQMFYETWVGLNENFYDEKFHGVNWDNMRKRYAAFLPYVNNRSDLRTLLNDMLGELNSSHMGFNSSGAEERKNLNYVTNETGIIFENENPLRVKRIAAKSNAAHTGNNVLPGDVLIAVNGIRVQPNIDRDYYFSKPSLDKEMTLTFSRGGKDIFVNLHPESAAMLRANLYDEWITTNRKNVDKWGNNRIAYSYMKNMSGGELESFLLDMVAQEENKDAIILDLRYNTGGNVHDDVLKFLSQRPYLQWKYRGGKLAPQSNFGPAAKPIVLLINEQSLSDAEMTAAGFKQLKLGKIIGTETYRWIIFTSAKGLVDGSSYRLPSWGCYTMDGQNLESNGVKPDIFVKNTFEDRLADKDPQLQKAVEEILKDLK